MTTFLLPAFWLYFIVFCFAIFLSFYIPGQYFLRNLKLTVLQKSVLALIFGMVLWGWQGFIFGFLGMRWLTYPYLLIFSLFWIKTEEWKKIVDFIRNFSIKKITFDKPLAFLVILGTLLQLNSFAFNGILGSNGISFCCIATPDLLYHTALTNQLVKEFPPTEPGMAGIIVHNYHYLSNLVTADLIRVFHLPLFATQFNYLALLLSLLFGLSAIIFGQIIQMKKSFLRWLIFFLYFDGDITYILSFLVGKGFNFSTPSLVNSLILWASPPRVFATVVFFAGISLLVLWTKQKRFSIGILVAIIFASLISFKIYFGIFMAAGVIALSIYYLFLRQFRMLLPLLLTGLLSLVFYLPVNSHAGGIVFTGMWRVEDFVVLPSFGLQHLELAKVIYAEHHNWFGVVRFEVFFFLLYLIFVFGTINLGWFQTKRSLSYFPQELNIFLFSGFCLSAILGFFFIQQSGGTNSSQFLITIDLLGSLYAALACYFWIGKLTTKLKYIAIFFIVLLTVPKIANVGMQQITLLLNNKSYVIDNNQLQALNYLKTKTSQSAIVLVDNLTNSNNEWKGNYSYYISFLANRSLFIDGTIDTNSIIQSHGVDTAQRVKDQETIIADTNKKVVKNLLQKNKISYIYLSSQTELAKYPPSFLKSVYQNSEVSILKVN